MVKGGSVNGRNNGSVNPTNLFLDLLVNVTIMTVDQDFSTVFLGSLKLVFVPVNGNHVSTKDVVSKLDPQVPETTGTND